MTIAVIGTGYVGLVSAACLAEWGNDVTGVDCDEEKVRKLQEGIVPIYEPGLEPLVLRHRAAGRLGFSTDLNEAVRRSTVIFIAVGTPQHEDGSADLRNVMAVASSVAHATNGHKVVVLKSTVPVGTNAHVHEIMAHASGYPVSVVSNPEFLKQGTAVRDFLSPDRVVIGAADPHATDVMKEIYAPATQGGAPLLVMDPASAELGKYAANAMLAVRISFMNEIANVCERFGADVDDVRRAVAADTRIGSAFLSAGLGYGGSCFPKDIRALKQFSASRGYDFKMLRAADEVNQLQRSRFAAKIEAYFGSLRDRTVAVWGLAFKPNTDDMREAPSIGLIRRLLELGARVQAHDPQAETVARDIFGNLISLADHCEEALIGADAVVVATEWDEYRIVDFTRMRALMRNPVVFDGRNLYDPETMEQLGFTYFSVGRRPQGPFAELGRRTDS